MRKLMWFTIGFAAACVLCANWFWEKNLLPLLVYFLLAGAFCFLLERLNELLRFPGVILSGLAAGVAVFFLFRMVYLQPAANLDGQIVPLTVTASDFSEQNSYGGAAVGYTQIDGRPYKVRVFLKGDLSLNPGDRLDCDFLVRMTTDGGQKESEYYQGSGCFLVLSQKGDGRITRSEQMSAVFLPAYLAKEAKRILQDCFPADTEAFARAILLGDTSGLTYRDDTALKLSGIRHIAAVSGLHVSFLFGLILLVFKTRRWLAFLVSVPVLFLFAAMVGFTPSITRACLMSGLMALSTAIFEEYDGLSSLSFSCLLMMAFNPLVCRSVAFQLSVASVAGILLFSSPIYQQVRGLFPRVKMKSRKGTVLNWVVGSVSVSVGAMVFTVPLTAYYFHTVSLVGLLTNLLTIWGVGIVFGSAAAVCILGRILPTAAVCLARAVSWLIRYILLIARILSGIPFGCLYTESLFVVIWLIGCYVLLFLFLVLGKKKLRFFLLIGTVGLVTAVVISVVEPKRDTLNLTVLDVGEGQCILLQSGDQCLMIDCGGVNDTAPADAAAQTLNSRGIFHLDGIAVTHYDSDHTGALQNLLTRIPSDRLFLPASDSIDSMTITGASGYEQMITISETTDLPFGDGTITFFITEPSKEDNDNCMCILFEAPECVILVTGDRSQKGERLLLAENSLPDVDILIAGHHGSKNSTSEDLLRAVSPEIVIISVGADNTYGHPARQTLARLMEYGCEIYRTDLQGNIQIRR